MTARTLLLWLLLLLPATAAAGLYDDTRALVTEELSTTEAEDYVATYIARFMQDTYPGITAEKVQLSIAGDWAGMCQGIDGGQTLNRPDCLSLHERIRRLAADEMRVRSTGRKLQTIATGYEIVLSELPNGLLRLPIEFAGIVNMWGTGTGSVRVSDTGSGGTLEAGGVMSVGTGTGYKVRTRALTEAEMSAVQSYIDDINAKLEALDDEQKNAAIWRYRYGYRLVKEEREPEYPAPVILQATGSGAERQYLKKRWTDLEDALEQLWNNLPDTFDPPLENDEAAYYILPDPIWARTDGNEENDYPLGDAGLQFPVALEPVLPSLLPDGYVDCLDGVSDPAACLSLGDPILGGLYPPQPKDEDVFLNDVGQCSQPVARRGFLCRPISDVADRECPDPEDLDPDAITLTSCEREGTERYALSGPDVCRQVDWRAEPANVFDGPVEDPEKQCAVATTDLECGSCDGFSGGITRAKQPDGHISVCVNSEVSIPTYYFLHELVHAKATCNLPVDNDPYQNILDDKDPYGNDVEEELDEDQKERRQGVLCCQWEGEAYRTQCDAMERDGGFLDEDGNPVVINGIELNAETCTELYLEASCQQRFEQSCFPTRDYGDIDEMGYIIGEMEEQVAEATADLVPTTCEDAKDPETMDIRVKAQLEGLQPGWDVCQPLHETEYANKIGNNFCFIGQCAEQSLEEYRIQGGNIPAVVGGQAYPWDSPLSWSPKGTLLLEPPEARAAFPPYNPRLLAQEMDLALCQLAGLPALTPPVLCAITAGELAENPLTDPVSAVQSIIQQQRGQENATSAALTGLPGYGARLGAELYAGYLRESVRSLAGMLDIANQLFRDIESIDFPEDMCPVDSTLPTANPSSSS